MPRDLRWTFLPDDSLTRIYEENPKLSWGYEKWCPTCLGARSYKMNGEVNTCDCQLQCQLAKHYLNAGIGDTYQRLDWDDFRDQRVRESLQKYVATHESYVGRGIGFLFHGTYGSGKTLGSTLVLKDLVKLGYSCYSVTFTSMVATFTAGWKDKEYQRFFENRIKRCDVLLLDDVGKEMRTKTNLSESVFDDVLRARVQANRPTIITTNETPEGIGKGYGAAVFSLLKEKSIMESFDSEDFRQKASGLRLEEIAKGETRPIY